MTIKVTVAILGRKRLERDLDVARIRLLPEMVRNVTKAATLIVGQAQRNVTGGTRTGAKWRIKGGKKVRRRNPGPVTARSGRLAVFEGRLRNSITADIRKVRRRIVEAELGPTVDYGKDHEEGLNGQKKRPFLRPAINALQERTFKLIGAAFRVLP